ncbi:BadF/BadG/BcrA/BcrD ATPase family protein [Chelativorans sp. Marseille-P2723]|uniref:BadF/BadG/BcrA/BcrD ATPase family protein n=1 Tax=Chelativorans sp. Marseille-P2723 TaxID=2709133 RepID=UPI001FEFED11|nr:BadF/BadG/BcrA/BcrD ATPase family protein [Chelativorans sp. Marseille-P2723]
MKMLIAVDGGGSGCRAAVADTAGRVLGRGYAGPANAMTDLDGALSHVVRAAQEALAAADLAAGKVSECPAVLGLAGVNVGQHGEKIRQQLPFSQSIVLSDAVTGLRGALGSGDGAAAIIGTGSVFGAQLGGNARFIGGWGFLLGDQASGAWLGRALLKRVLLAQDKVAANSDMTKSVLSRFNGNAEEIIAFAHQARPAHFAAFAPEIFSWARQGDPVAKSLVSNGVSAIEAHLRAVMPQDCPRICFIGGLGASYVPYLGAAFRANLKPALGTGLDGALAIAVERFG